MSRVRTHPATCTMTGCTKKFYARGWCKMHHQRWWKFGDPNANFSKNHNGAKCKVEDCDRAAKVLGWCRMHHKRFYRHGDPLHRTKAPDGVGHVREDGYRIFTAHGKSHFEHIARAQKALGKPLPPGAVVHHMNEDRSDNTTPFNLVICPDQAYHFLLHKRSDEMRKYGRCFSTEYGRKKRAKLVRVLVKNETIDDL